MKKLVYISAALLFMSSCSSDDDGTTDTTKPVISISEPEMEEHFQQGSEIHFEGKITDETALSQMRIDVHLGDGHDHDGKANLEEWDHEQTWDISGKEYDFHEDIAIPADADTGMYHFIVYALDKAGNSANFVEIDIHITEK